MADDPEATLRADDPEATLRDLMAFYRSRGISGKSETQLRVLIKTFSVVELGMSLIQKYDAIPPGWDSIEFGGKITLRDMLVSQRRELSWRVFVRRIGGVLLAVAIFLGVATLLWGGDERIQYADFTAPALKFIPPVAPFKKRTIEDIRNLEHWIMGMHGANRAIEIDSSGALKTVRSLARKEVALTIPYSALLRSSVAERVVVKVRCFTSRCWSAKNISLLGFLFAQAFGGYKKLYKHFKGRHTLHKHHFLSLYLCLHKHENFSYFSNISRQPSRSRNSSSNVVSNTAYKGIIWGQHQHNTTHKCLSYMNFSCIYEFEMEMSDDCRTATPCPAISCPT